MTAEPVHFTNVRPSSIPLYRNDSANDLHLNPAPKVQDTAHVSVNRPAQLDVISEPMTKNNNFTRTHHDGGPSQEVRITLRKPDEGVGSAPNCIVPALSIVAAVGAFSLIAGPALGVAIGILLPKAQEQWQNYRQSWCNTHFPSMALTSCFSYIDNPTVTYNDYEGNQFYCNPNSPDQCFAFNNGAGSGALIGGALLMGFGSVVGLLCAYLAVVLVTNRFSKREHGDSRC